MNFFKPLFSNDGINASCGNDCSTYGGTAESFGLKDPKDSSSSSNSNN